MKNNTDELKTSLQRALSKCTEDFALQEVRNHIKIALSKIEEVEKKRQHRESLFEKRVEKRKEKRKENYFNPLKALKAIEKEISKEENKLNKNKERDDGYIQELFD